MPAASKALKLAPSLLSADFSDLGSDIRAAEEGGADAFHLDVMDGHFVPNISFGPAMVRAVRRRTKLPLDIHLMVSQPSRHLAAFAEAGGDTLAFHAEVSEDLTSLVDQVRSLGKSPGIALRPDTPLERVRHLLPTVDEVVVMTVHPGFSGQKFITEVLDKMRETRSALDRLGHPCELSVDGGVTVETIERAAAAGATFFVCGNSTFVGGSPQTNLPALRAAGLRAVSHALH